MNSRHEPPIYVPMLKLPIKIDKNTVMTVPASTRPWLIYKFIVNCQFWAQTAELRNSLTKMAP